MGAETDIELKPVFSTQGIKSSARNLRKEIEGIFDTNAGKKLDAQMQNLMNRMSTLANKSRQVARAMEELANTKIPTTEYKALEKESARLEKQLEKAEIKAENLKEVVGSTDIRYRKAHEDAVYLAEQLENVKQKMEELRASGKDVTLGSSSEQMRKLEEQQRNLYNQMAITVNKAYELDPALRQGGTSGQVLSNVLSRVAASAADVASTIGIAMRSFAKFVGTNILKGLAKMRNYFAKLASSIHGTGNALNKLNFSKILKYAFGVRSMYFLFRKLRKAIMDGVNNLAQFQGGNNRVNESLSQLKSALTQLKNAWGTAFAPVISYVMPVLLQLVDWLTKVANTISMVMSYLGGNKTFYKATKVQEDYAKSLDKTASSAGAAYKKLAPFDDLQVLGNDKGGGGGTSPDSMFEEIAIPEDFTLPDASQLGKNFAQWLKDALDSIPWDEIKEKAENLGRNIAKFLNEIWMDKELARKLGNAIAQCINTAIRFVYGFVDETKWDEMGDWFKELILTALRNIEWDKAGETFGKLITGLATAINHFLSGEEDNNVIDLLADGLTIFIQNATANIKTNEVGTAIGNVLAAPFRFINRFIPQVATTEFFNQIGDLISDIFTNKLANDKTLGTNIGEAIGTLINAGITFLKSNAVDKIAKSLGGFLTDVVRAAVDKIEWSDALDGILNLPRKIPKGLAQGIYESFNGPLSETQQKVYDSMSGSWSKLWQTFTNDFLQTGLPVYSEAFEELENAQQYKMSRLMNYLEFDYNAINDITKDSWKSIQDTWKLSDEEMDTLIQTAIDSAERHMNKNKDIRDQEMLILKGEMADYNGEWSTFIELDKKRDTLLDNLHAKVATEGDVIDKITGKIQDSGKISAATAELIKTATDRMDTAAITAAHDAEEITRNLNEINANQAKESVEKFGDAAVTSSAKVSHSSAEIKASLDEWFQQTIQKYFSEEQWTTLGDNITNAMSSAMTTFQENWTASMEVWREQLELDFGLEAWTLRFENITTAYTEWWTTFSETWAMNIKTWATTHIEPYFSVETWKKYGQQMNDGIMGGFKTIVGKIAGLLNNIIDLFNAAFAKLEDAMNDLIDDFNKSASQLGVPSLSRVSYHPMSKIQVPALARGAVIPPNREFLAMLGDQRHGTNIEAPLDTIKQAFADVVANMQVSNTGYSEMTLDGETFARLLTPYVISELNRSGYNVKVLEA